MNKVYGAYYPAFSLSHQRVTQWSAVNHFTRTISMDEYIEKKNYYLRYITILFWLNWLVSAHNWWDWLNLCDVIS